VSQLRINSVRQSKVRVIEDALCKGHFDVVVGQEMPEGGNPMLPMYKTATQLRQPKDVVLSHSAVLHRTNHRAKDIQQNLSALPHFARVSRPDLYNEFPDAQCS